MASYIKASLERSYAESFLAELERNENQYFFFVGKGTTWANENSPSAYTDTVASEYQVMNDIIGYKKLNPANIIFALPRYAWTSGTVYDQYDDAVELFDEDDPSIFYVVTDENNIYKCLGNNNGGESTEKPAQVLSTPFTTSDGYRWQYLSTIRESDLPYELVDYIPVDFATLSSDTETVNQYNTQTEAVNGSITRMVVSNSSGASAGVYPNAISAETLGSINTTFVLSVGSYTEIDGVKKVRITESNSVSRLTTVASASAFGVNGYVGHAMRINQSTVNTAQINNYGIITAVTSGTNFYEFTIADDVVDFTVTAPTVATDFVSVEILPHIRITGNGNGAYAFSVMNSSKNIASANVVNGGRNYSKTSVEVVSQKNTVTNHPSIRSVLSPKGGHGSNILKELNVKDILVIVEITEQDAETIISGGSYRQFGIIKNPLLNDGTFTVAGKESLYYRDITLIPESGIVDQSIFDSTNVNLIVGAESYSAAKVSSVKATSATTITLKTLNSSGQFITKQDRNNDFVLTLTTAPAQNFILGEIVTQTVPAGTVLSSGVQYGYDLVAKGRVLSVNSAGTQIVVRLTTDGNFVSGVAVEGEQSLVTATVSAVAPRYGEYVWVTNRNINGTPQFVVNGVNDTLYKVVDVGQAYFDLDTTPLYRGLHVLELSTSISAATAGVDTTSSALTRNSYANGDVVHQGVTGQFGHYATGIVYNWEFVNDSYGKLYLTDVVGSFKSVETDGLTGTQLGAYVVSTVQEPEIDRSSGEVLYINNVRPIQRIYAQEEEFRLRLGF
jgi:hypothetical protein